MKLGQLLHDSADLSGVKAVVVGGWEEAWKWEYS